MDAVVDFNLVQGEKGAVRWHHPVSFTLQRGTAHVIRTRSQFSGPLLRLCLGFSEPSSGAMTVQGTEPWKLARGPVRELRKGMGTVLDPDGLVANLSVRMNLIVPLVFATGLEFDVAQERAAQMLEVMHLNMWADVRPAGLPAEVRQAAALARALCPDPSLLLLENPLASLDNRETRRLLSLCRARVETLLIATHRSDSILHEFADQVWDWDDDGFRVAA
jgi:ABC-type transporter Mla maintaining outer membrane lipid asymmetry ATPase subunit MlaF